MSSGGSRGHIHLRDLGVISAMGPEVSWLPGLTVHVHMGLRHSHPMGTLCIYPPAMINTFMDVGSAMDSVAEEK